MGTLKKTTRVLDHEISVSPDAKAIQKRTSRKPNVIESRGETSGVKPKTQARSQGTIQLPEIELNRLEIVLIGDSPLIMHKWSEKAIKEMLDKQMKLPKQARGAKDPEAEILACVYRDDNGHPAFPTIAFKSAVVDACRFADGMKMVVLRGAFHIEGELVRIDSSEPIPRQDMVRVGMGTADIRFRPEFRDWRARLRLSYNSRVISAAELVNLFNLAGFGVGVGEWRPEKNGQFGRFHVAREGE